MIHTGKYVSLTQLTHYNSPRHYSPVICSPFIDYNLQVIVQHGVTKCGMTPETDLRVLHSKQSHFPQTRQHMVALIKKCVGTIFVFCHMSACAYTRRLWSSSHVGPRRGVAGGPETKRCSAEIQIPPGALDTQPGAAGYREKCETSPRHGVRSLNHAAVSWRMSRVSCSVILLILPPGLSWDATTFGMSGKVSALEKWRYEDIFVFKKKKGQCTLIKTFQ